MAKKFRITNQKALDLKTMIDLLDPQKTLDACGTNDVRSLKNVLKATDEIADSIKDFTDLRQQVIDALEEERRPFQKEMDDNMLSSDDEDLKKRKEGEIGRRAVKVLTEKDREISERLGFAAKKEEEVEVTVGSDDRFELVRKMVEKEGVRMFKDKRVLVEIVDALDSAEPV